MSTSSLQSTDQVDIIILVIGNSEGDSVPDSDQTTQPDSITATSIVANWYGDCNWV